MQSIESIHSDRCYVCGFSRRSLHGRSLYFHNAPSKIHCRADLDKWLTFLKLPRSSEWDNQEWRKISLCSLHFTENDYPPGLSERVRVVLRDGAVPTKNPPMHCTSTTSKEVPPFRFKAMSSSVKESKMESPVTRNKSLITMEKLSAPVIMECSIIREYLSSNNSEILSCLACSVTEGSTEYHEEHLQLFKFPLHPEKVHVLSKWLKFCNLLAVCLDELKNKRLCSRHFGSQDYIPGSPDGQKSLQSHAVPHIGPPKQHSAAALEILQRNSALTDLPEFNIKSDLEEASIRDSLLKDHDYLGHRRKAKEQHISDKEDELLENTHSQVLENVKKELCRICGQKGDILIPICETSFEHMTDDMLVSTKVEMHLPLKVDKDDLLPLHICLTCSDLLNRWHELYVTCVAADAVLRKTFGIKSFDVPSNTLLNPTFNRVPDEVNQPVINDHLEAKNTQEIHSSLWLNANEKSVEVCEKCGRSRSVETDEESMFQDTFQNSINHPSLLCKICREPFTSPLERRNHFIMCRQLPTICDECGMEVHHRKDLTRHKTRRHRQKAKGHMCDKCAKCFRTNCQLMNHMAVHQRGSVPKHFCNLCCKTFYAELYYDSHMKKHKEGKLKGMLSIQTFCKNEDIAVYVCPVCHQVFKDALSLVIHLTSKKEMKCKTCHQKIFNERRYILHKCKTWNCQYCGKSFTGKVQWENHERIHTGERPYKCKICDAVFRTATVRLRHERRHNPLIFQCSYCNKEFKTKYVFQDHLNSHMGQHVSCNYCDKKFSSRKTLYKHIKAIHGNCETLKKT